MQDFNTKPEDIQFPGETWCVNTYQYRELDGGYALWEAELARVKPDILYLYSVIHKNLMIDGFLQTVYIIRAELKKK